MSYSFSNTPARPALPAEVREAATERYYSRSESGESAQVLHAIHTAIVAVTFPSRYTKREVEIATRFVALFAEAEAAWEDMEDVAAAFYIAIQ